MLSSRSGQQQIRYGQVCQALTFDIRDGESLPGVDAYIDVALAICVPFI
jgi:hypothetical protein